VQQKPTCSIHYKMLILNDLSSPRTLSWTILSPLRLPVPPSRPSVSSRRFTLVTWDHTYTFDLAEREEGAPSSL
jgi:hypothetical protein